MPLDSSSIQATITGSFTSVCYSLAFLLRVNINMSALLFQIATERKRLSRPWKNSRELKATKHYWLQCFSLFTPRLYRCVRETGEEKSIYVYV